MMIDSTTIRLLSTINCGAIVVREKLLLVSLDVALMLAAEEVASKPTLLLLAADMTRSCLFVASGASVFACKLRMRSS